MNDFEQHFPPCNSSGLSQTEFPQGEPGLATMAWKIMPKPGESNGKTRWIKVRILNPIPKGVKSIIKSSHVTITGDATGFGQLQVRVTGPATWA